MTKKTVTLFKCHGASATVVTSVGMAHFIGGIFYTLDKDLEDELLKLTYDRVYRIYVDPAQPTIDIEDEMDTHSRSAHAANAMAYATKFRQGAAISHSALRAQAQMLLQQASTPVPNLAPAGTNVVKPMPAGMQTTATATPSALEAAQAKLQSAAATKTTAK